MSTNSTIAVQHADGSVSQVYCHWDGYVSWNGKMLIEHYNTLEKAEALVALGWISSLYPSIECPEGHSFETPVKGYTVVYGRDRGTENCEPATFETLSEYFLDGMDEEYNYLFRNGEWEVISYKTDNQRISVAEALEREDAAAAE